MFIFKYFAFTKGWSSQFSLMDQRRVQQSELRSPKFVLQVKGILASARSSSEHASGVPESLLKFKDIN